MWRQRSKKINLAFNFDYINGNYDRTYGFVNELCSVAGASSQTIASVERSSRFAPAF